MESDRIQLVAGHEFDDLDLAAFLRRKRRQVFLDRHDGAFPIVECFVGVVVGDDLAVDLAPTRVLDPAPSLSCTRWSEMSWSSVAL